MRIWMHSKYLKLFEMPLNRFEIPSNTWYTLNTWYTCTWVYLKAKSLEIPWNGLKSLDFHWKFLELSWRTWKPLKYSNTHKWHPLKTHEIPWDPIKSKETLSNTFTLNNLQTENYYKYPEIFHEIPWYFIKTHKIPKKP